MTVYTPITWIISGRRILIDEDSIYWGSKVLKLSTLHFSDSFPDWFAIGRVGLRSDVSSPKEWS